MLVGLSLTPVGQSNSNRFAISSTCLNSSRLFGST